jgi:hypothetical protein
VIRAPGGGGASGGCGAGARSRAASRHPNIDTPAWAFRSEAARGKRKAKRPPRPGRNLSQHRCPGFLGQADIRRADSPPRRGQHEIVEMLGAPSADVGVAASTRARRRSRSYAELRFSRIAIGLQP